MDFITLLGVMAIMLCGMAWYANYSKRDKIYCTFRRINKTKIEKFVKMTSEYVIFDKWKYDIVPSSITFIWWDKGLIHQIFPQWVASLDYSYHSRFPHNPNKMRQSWETPEVRKAINKREWVLSYAKGFTPPTRKAESGLNKYIPWIAVIMVLLVAGYVMMNMQGLAVQINMLEENVKALAR